MPRMVYQMKQSFILFTTICFIVLLSFYMINIFQNKLFLSNIVKLKYYNLQLKVYKQDLINYIKTHTKQEIENFKLNDNRIDLKIIEETKTKKFIKYYVVLDVIDEPVRDVFYIKKARRD